MGAGTWLVDHIKVIDEWPQQDTLCTILSSRPANGGLPYNVLKDLSKMELPAPLEAAGLIGDDADGKYILDDCRAHNIAPLFEISRECGTSFTDVITVQSTGRRTFFHSPAGNNALEPRHIPLEKSAAKIFLEGYFGLHEKMDALDAGGMSGHAKIFKRAKELGFITVADAVSRKADFCALTRSALPHIDYMSLNEIELKMVAGGDALDCPDIKRESSLKKYAAQVLERGVGKYLIVHFPECVYAFAQGGGFCRQPSVSLPRGEIKGAVGAGDALLAGIIFGIHENWDMPECLKLGSCAAAKCLGDVSSSDGMESWRECMKLESLYGYGEY